MGVNDTAEHDVCVAVGYNLGDLAFEMRFGLGDPKRSYLRRRCRCQMRGDRRFESGFLQRRVGRTSRSFSAARSPGAFLDDLQFVRDLVRLAPTLGPPGRSGSADRNKRVHTNALTSGAVSRRGDAAMGPNSASPSPQPRSDSYGLARRDARGLFVRLFLPG